MTGRAARPVPEPEPAAGGCRPVAVAVAGAGPAGDAARMTADDCG
jgi:hypothetical protein